jgi:hypothetical protein
MQYLINDIKHLICPSCKGKYKVSCSSEYKANSYFTKIDAKDNFQIVYSLSFMLMKKALFNVLYSEVMQHFVVEMAELLQWQCISGNMGMYYDSWRHGSELNYGKTTLKY